MLNDKYVEGFWSYVEQGDENECWVWQGGKIPAGYGRFRTRYAHRLSWEMAHGPIPAGMCVCHTCDNPSCVNPEHLFLGTNADNAHDRDRKGRTARGKRHGRSKLTRADVLAIRTRAKRGEVQKALAEEYGVTPANISYVVRGKRWTWLQQGVS